MATERAELLRGTLDLLILKALSLEPLNGVDALKRIEQITGGRFRVSFGSLFPSLHRMEEKGWLAAECGPSEAGWRAEYYRLTEAGKAQLDVERREWNRVVAAMALAIDAT